MRDPILTARAKTMRHTPTEPEKRLWLALRAKRFEQTKFRRQNVVGPYIVDFAARDPMLVIELDGDTHAGREGYDQAGTTYLQARGYRVTRFTNRDVMADLDGVLQVISDATAPSPLPTLSPEGERAS